MRKILEKQIQEHN